MNPKSINDLDPKLKETYERVMGTSFAGGQTVVPPTMETQPVSQPAGQSPLGGAQQEIQAQEKPEPQVQVETPATPSNEDTTVSQVFRADNQDKASESTTASSPSSSKNEKSTKLGGNKLLPIIIIGAIVFLAVYAVIWAKVLGLFKPLFKTYNLTFHYTSCLMKVCLNHLKMLPENLK